MKTNLELSELFRNSKLICKYKSSDIIGKYKQIFDIDVEEFFKDIPEIQLRKDLITGYQFFYPFTLSGNGQFYKDLQKISWYYADWRWEFDIAYDLIEKDKKVLEIGCGEGFFLEKLQEKCECLGLELNDEAGTNTNVKILNETIEKFALSSSEEYDWVISFQVLEHIADVHSFISNSLKVLKKGGKLLIAVPNNEANFFKNINLNFLNQEYLQTLLLNMPPHHMGKWNFNVFYRLQSIYNLDLIYHKKQGIQPWRKELNKLIISFKFNGIIRNVVKRLLSHDKIYTILQRLFVQYRYGDCILVVFNKK